MSKMYFGSIDLNKIDKSRIILNDKNGVRFKNGAKYYPIIIWINDKPYEHGSIGTIKEAISKEERESGKQSTTIAWLRPSVQLFEDKSAEDVSTGIADDDPLPF